MYDLSNKISKLRRDNNMTQEQLAEKLGVTAQSVSKWENGITSPDITLIPAIAKLFNITTDELLGAVSNDQVKKISSITSKEMKELKLKVHIISKDGDKVNVQLPYIFVKTAIHTGIKIPSISDKIGEIDFESIFECVEMGMLGKVVDIESKDGDIIEVSVE